MTNERERLRGLRGWVVNNDHNYRLGSGNTTRVNLGIIDLMKLCRGISEDAVALAVEDVRYINAAVWVSEDERWLRIKE